METASEATSHPSSYYRTAPKTILIVDDRPINREVLSILLEEQKYQILEAENGIEALALLLNNKIDLIITDIIMPKMDGLALVQELQANLKLINIPVIFYSATYKAAEASRLASANNVKYVLTKPCEPQMILNTIKQALQENTVPQKINTFDDSEINRKREKLENANFRLTNLIEIGLNISSEREIEKLIFIACKGGKQLLNACYSGVIIMNSHHQEFYKAFNVDREDTFFRKKFEMQHCSYAFKEIFSNQKPICIHSPLINFSEIGLTNIALPVTSFLMVPIKTISTTYGYMYFINKFNASLFNISDQRLMMTLADKLATRYENIILFEEKERNEKRLEDEITQRKELEAVTFHHKYHLELAELNRVTSMGEMASTLAHELNQPLTAILTYTQTCIRKLQNQKQTLLATEVIEGLNLVVQQAERSGILIHRMKDFIRKGTLLLQYLNINDILSNLLSLMQYEKRNTSIEIALDCAESLPLVYIDKVQIEQVILNLVRNAVEALKDTNILNPKIIIKTTQEKDNTIAINVLDNGHGVSAKIKDNLFSPYVTTKSTGTGMGLAISRTIVEAHGGQLLVTQHEGMTCFRFTLPIKQTEG